MAVLLTVQGTYTPHCGECGIALCYDLSEQEYTERKEFWDNWDCSTCNPSYLREEMKKEYANLQLQV